jgi:hypothetical protein
VAPIWNTCTTDLQFKYVIELITDSQIKGKIQSPEPQFLSPLQFILQTQSKKKKKKKKTLFASVLSTTNKGKQSQQSLNPCLIIRSMFSATLRDFLEDLARTIMHNAIRVIVGRN